MNADQNAANDNLKVEEEKKEPKRSPFKLLNKKSPSQREGAFLFPKKGAEKVFSVNNLNI